MTLRQLRCFVELSRTGSVAAAAERLFVTQPAVSAVVASLQRELRATLVVRSGRGLRLTPAGEVLAGYANRILGLLDEAAAATAGMEAPERGRVRIAGVTTAGEQLLPRLIAGFRSRYPAAGVRLEVANRARVWQLLENQEVDLVVGGRPPEGTVFRTGAVRDNDLVVVARAGDVPRSGRRRLPLDEIARRTWLLREPGSGTRATVEEYLAAHSLNPPTLTLGSNGAILESLAVGLGITLLSRDAVQRELGSRRLEILPVAGTPLRRWWHVVTRGDQRLPATAALFLDDLLVSGEFVRP